MMSAAASPGGPAEPVPAAFAREFDDRFLAEALELEEDFPGAWSPVLGDYRGFNLVYHRGLLYALDVDEGDVQPRGYTDDEVSQP